MIEQIETQARQQLAASTATKPRASVAALHKGHTVEIQARLLATGKELFGYSYDSIRLERSVLLQLLCTETDCPACQQTQANWIAFRGIAKVASRSTQQSFQFKHLVEEVSIEAAGRSCVARPAAFQCRVACPAMVHPPSVVRTMGWDLFADGIYLGGGLTTHPETQMPMPLLPSIDAAKSWLAQQDCAAFA